MRRCFTPPSLAPLLFALLLLLLLQGGEKFVRAEEAYLDECCQKGLIWAREKLRCEKFSGALPGVSKAELPACYETIEICCVKAFQEAQCELGKRDARADQVCRGVNAEEPPSGSSLGLGDFRRSCCEACKLGLLSGSDGKACDKKFSLGAAWDPAYAECCLGANKTRTSRMAAGNNGNILDTTDNNELDFDFSDSTDFTTSAPLDLCKLLKGLLCTDICVPTPNSYYCKCKDGMVLQPDGRSCQPNVTTTVAPLVKSTSTSAATKPKTTSTPKVTTSTSSSAAKPKTTSKPKSTSTAKPKTTSTPKTSKTTTSKNNLDTDFDHRTSMKLMQRLKSTSTSASKPTSTSAPKSTTSTTTHRTTSAKKTPRTTTKHVETTTKIRRTTGAKSTVEKTIEQMLNHLTTGREHHRSTRSASAEDNELGQTTCPSGYRFTAANTPCEDIDECAEKSAYCPATSVCVNSVGSYRCVENVGPGCELGYRWNATLERCDDVDECMENTHKCLAESETCRNLEGSYECEVKCERGFIFNVNYGACLDVNECTELTNICPQPDTICINSLGSYECRRLSEYSEPFAGLPDERRPGDYEGVDEPDIDECQAQPQPCAPGELCRNTPAGYDCIPPACPRGFSLVGEQLCQDVDECALGLHACSEHERCQNTNGSFTCEPPRTTRRPTTSEPPRTICRKGFKLDNATDNCLDVDECVEGPGCRDHERCRNTIGSYDCSPLCGPGWYFQLRTKTCQDVDECLLGRHNCRQRTQFCRNTNGSYVCEPLPICGSGYRRNGHDGSCVDVDECLEGLHNCARAHHRYCVNLDGGYECITRLPACPRGFEYSLLTQDCLDIDECRTGKAGCDPSLGERCLNLPGGYRCERPPPEPRPTRRRPACPAGYSYDPALRKCSDIDECTEGSHNCGEQKCYNLPGTFQCAKAPLPAARRKPTTSPATTAKTPANTTTTRPSSATGEKCSPGHRYDQKLGRCVDVDECAEQEEACSSSNEECRNTEGSFECVCRPGFRRDGLTRACIDINECQLKNDCLPSQRCDNTIGSYVCVRFLPCGTGYTLNAATEICEDDDECALATHDCGPGYHCRNTLGSFRCDKLRGGRPPSYSTTTTTTTTTTTAMPTTRRTSRPTFRTTPRTPGNLTTAIPIARVTTAQPKITSSTTTPRGSVNSTALTTTTEEIPTVRTLTTATVKPKTTSVAVRPRTNCPRGFEVGSFGQCIDIDECNRNVKLCGIQRCINTLGSFKCEPKVLCDIGYIPDRITGQCKDIDECAQGTHKCGPQQTCENRPGGYVCYCPSGFEVGGDHKCVDIDECSRVAGLCGSGGRCVNSPGSYSCICRHGFENDPANGGCRDVDECMSSKPCHQECYNTWGGHRCACRFGYRLRPDNRTCEDVDECTEFKDNHLCLGICDNTPGSYVCRCPEGYNLSEDGRTCVDIDECATGNACKATGDLCQNLRGSFRCNRIICPPGYIRDTHRTNRCMRESRFCPMHDQACLQRPAHYTYNYIGIVAMYPIPPNTGQVELFTMRGAYDLPGSSVRFNLALISARSPPRVRPATEDCFALRIPFPAQAVLVMTKSLQGPQDVELELSMEIYGPNNVLAGSAVAKIFIIVTQYEF